MMFSAAALRLQKCTSVTLPSILWQQETPEFLCCLLHGVSEQISRVAVTVAEQKMRSCVRQGMGSIIWYGGRPMRYLLFVVREAPFSGTRAHQGAVVPTFLAPGGEGSASGTRLVQVYTEVFCYRRNSRLFAYAHEKSCGSLYSAFFSSPIAAMTGGW